MGAKGKIGLILPEINSALDHAFLEGACDQGMSLGYDVIVYTGIFNSLREVRFDQYIAGLENTPYVLTEQLSAIAAKKS